MDQPQGRGGQPDQGTAHPAAPGQPPAAPHGAPPAAPDGPPAAAPSGAPVPPPRAQQPGYPQPPHPGYAPQQGWAPQPVPAPQPGYGPQPGWAPQQGAPQPGWGQQPQPPYGQTPNGQTPNGQTPDGQTPNGQTPDGQAPDGQAPYGQAAYGQVPYGQAAPYAQGPYAPPHAPYAQPGPAAPPAQGAPFPGAAFPGAPFPGQPGPRPGPAARVRLTGDDVTTALKVVAWALLPALAVLTVVVAIVASASLDSGHTGSLADWLRTAVALLALGLGGRITADGALGSSLASASMTAGLRLVPLLVTLAAVVLAGRASVRAERRSPSAGLPQLLARAGLAGVGSGVVVLVLAALCRTSDVYGVNLAEELEIARSGGSVGVGLLGAFVGPLLFVGVAVAVARLVASVPRGLPLPGALARLRASADLATAARVLRTFAVGLVAAGALAVVLTYLDRALLSDDFSDGQFPAFVGVLVFFVNLVGAAVLGAFGVPFVWSGNGSGDTSGFVSDVFGSGGSSSSGSFGMVDEPVLLLALLVPLALLLGTAVRRVLRQVPFVATGRAVGSGALIGAVTGLAAALLLRIGLTASVSGGGTFGSLTAGGSGSAGLSLLWAPLLGAAWAALAVWVTRFGATLALSLPAGLTRRIAGRGIAPHWAAALAGAAPAPAGHRSRGVRLTALAGAVLAVLALVGTGVVAVLDATVYTPQAAAEDYLSAVARGDVSGAVDHLATTPPTANQPLLSSAIHGSGDFSPIGSVSVGSVHRYGDRSASVQVSYQIAGSRHSDSLYLVRGDDTLGVLDSWKVSGSLPALTVDTGDGLGATIAGHPLPEGRYVALPGQYTVHPVENSYLTADPRSVVVGSDSGASVSFTGRVKASAITRATQAVQQKIQQCAQQTSAPLSGCPFLSSTTLTGLSMTIDRMPTFTVRYDSSSRELEVVSRNYGTVHVVGTQASWFDGSPTPYDSVQYFYVDGTVSFQGDDTVVSLDD